MKILFLTNNLISHRLIHWLKEMARENVSVIDYNISKETIIRYKPEFLISYNYNYIIRREVLKLMKEKAINLHISFLPWNRGAHPNLWSFLEDTPKGVTIHFIDGGIDTGRILLQEKVLINEQKETLFSSYLILHRELQNLFISHWTQIKNSAIIPKIQSTGGSIHYRKDYERIKQIFSEEGWHLRIRDAKLKFKKLLEKRNLVQ